MKLQNRINDPTIIDEDLIENELKAGKFVIVQFVNKTYDDKILEKINELCLKYDENFNVRFYGHHQTSFDCKTVLKIPNVKSLFVDCLMRAENVFALSELKNLYKLHLGVYELKETEILNFDNFKDLIELGITDTRTTAFNLEYLNDYNNLKFLMIGGHSKNIDAVGGLSKLETLYLNSIRRKPVHFVNRLKKLKSLAFILGGRENIDEIGGNEIENLEIVWVRGFNNLDNISNFSKLKTIKIEDQIQITKINFDKEIKNLSELRIFNCKKLESLSGLKNLPSLNSLFISQTDIDFNQFIQQNLPESLKNIGFYTKSLKTNEKIKESILEKGYFCR